ncbi:hypothetical protein FB451DRAFT_1394105 [Mycena latifolia]|nr:hypothetical protein FB451DRAFT_1394105 [Mycena latifolia]
MLNIRVRMRVLSNTLGSPAYEALLKTLKPARWCAGHMHVRFTAEVIDVPTPEAHRPLRAQVPAVPPAAQVPALVVEALAWVQQNVTGGAELKAVDDVQVFA